MNWDFLLETRWCIHATKSTGRERTDSCHGAPLLHIGAQCLLMWAMNEVNAATVGLTVNAWLAVDSGRRANARGATVGQTVVGRLPGIWVIPTADQTTSTLSQLFCDTSPNTRHVILATDNYTELYLYKDTHHAWRNFPFMSPNLTYQEKTSCALLMLFYTPATCFRSSLCPSYLHFILYTHTPRPDIYVRRSSGS